MRHRANGHPQRPSDRGDARSGQVAPARRPDVRHSGRGPAPRSGRRHRAQNQRPRRPGRSGRASRRPAQHPRPGPRAERAGQGRAQRDHAAHFGAADQRRTGLRPQLRFSPEPQTLDLSRRSGRRRGRRDAFGRTQHLLRPRGCPQRVADAGDQIDDPAGNRPGSRPDRRPDSQTVRRRKPPGEISEKHADLRLPRLSRASGTRRLSDSRGGRPVRGFAARVVREPPPGRRRGNLRRADSRHDGGRPADDDARAPPQHGGSGPRVGSRRPRLLPQNVRVARRLIAEVAAMKSLFSRACRILFAWIATIGLMAALVAQASAAEGRERVYFGTYGNGPTAGVFVAELDLATGTVSEPPLAGRAVNASFVALAPDHRHLYAVAEVSSLGGRRTGGVVAFAVVPETGALRPINEQSSGGAGPCHLVVDKAGKNVLVADYEGGAVAVLPIDEHGGVRPASSVMQHRGHGVNRERQEAAHAHSVNLDAANHLAFAYAIDELDSTITAFWYDADNGTLSRIQVVSTLPKDFHGVNTASEVAVHPSGKYVYGANRGHDSIAIFTVDAASGKLTPDGHESTQGKTPRNFAIDPTGSFLLAANQDSDSVVVFRIAPATGRLRPTGQKLRMKEPVCVRYVLLGRS